ncbi:MAG: hypothetical protein GWP07_01330, partial [Xanthomonadaceae bacterium]|nr:hypothetical protein [Xanthomonadaceae bacterium]
MSRIHSIVIAILFVLATISSVYADNPNPNVFNMYVTPSISGYVMHSDNQKHERKYEVYGTAEITYDSSYTAYTPEHYEFEIQATYNWVSCYYQEHVVLTAGTQELNYEAHRTLPQDEMLHLDPVLFYPGWFFA